MLGPSRVGFRSPLQGADEECQTMDSPLLESTMPSQSDEDDDKRKPLKRNFMHFAFFGSPSAHVSDEDDDKRRGATFPKLHAGFGAISDAQCERIPYKWATASLIVAVVGTIMSGYLFYLLHGPGGDVYDILSIWNETAIALQLKDQLNPDESQRVDAVSNLVMLPLFFGVINHFVVHLRRTTFWWDEDYCPAHRMDGDTEPASRGAVCCSQCRKCIDPLAFPPFLIAALWNLRSCCTAFFKDPIGRQLGEFCKFIIAMMALFIYYEVLDVIEGKLHALKQHQFDTVCKFARIQKSQKRVAELVRTGSETDIVSSFAHARTVPAEILQYAWWAYYIVAKLLGIIFALSVFMGFTLNFVLVISGLTAFAFIFDLGPNLLSLVRLALFNPFYLGDIVTLNSDGSHASPETAIVGFVENITISYVVIRNFEMKQTWIPHKKFSEFVIQNWSRRPTKTVHLNFGISCDCSSTQVEKLAKFGKKWIEQSPDILNGRGDRRQGYIKCHITGTGNGYNVEVIFYPDIGVSHREIRQKFILAFMAAAKRLKILFVPLRIQQNFCRADSEPWSGFSGPQPDDLQEFLPSEDTPLRRKHE